jgi:DNA primase
MIVPSPTTKEFLEMAVSSYEDQIEGTEAQRYFVEERGITKEALSSFRIGFVGRPQRGHEMYQGRIAFPYITHSGVTTIRFRRVGDDPNQKKMLYLPGDTPRIYNVTKISDRKVLICEGEVDTITATICGYDAVGIPGATAWKRAFIPIFRYRSVTVVAHNDDNGEGLDFARKIASALDSVTIQLCPKGSDLNKLYVTEGVRGVKELLGE